MAIDPATRIPPASSAQLGTNQISLQAFMPYTCQTCAKRKVKCDKATPTCSTCLKSKLECFYQAPPPRRRKRKLSGDVNEKLSQYERILQQHGLLPKDDDASPSTEDTQQESVSLRTSEPETLRSGKLLAGKGKSRYIDSNLWRNLGDDEISDITGDDEEDQLGTGVGTPSASDPLTAAFMGAQQDLVQYHPTHAEAMMMWESHVESVEPICRILHIPSTSMMVLLSSQQPKTASKAQECLLFAIYHFAIYSMAEEQCAEKFEQSRSKLLQRYHFAARQALVNAGFLRTTEMAIMQAFVLFLLACRYSYDPHTYWILTGVAVRVAQRMGLHRDGKKLGLPPFDVQMRRRLFYQLLPLDGIASHMSGTGIAVIQDTWDTQQPLNLNDDQIWPGMTETPEEQKGATEMIFCLTRSCLGTYFARVGPIMQGTITGQRKADIESLIGRAETEVEEKFLRYCDIVDPLHFLTLCSARSAITAMHLRMLLSKIKDQTATEAERKTMFQLSLKIIDTDAAAYAHTSLERFRWHVRTFFLWGSWDSLVFILTSLHNSGLLSPADSAAAWSRAEQVYNNHEEFLESKRALHIAVRRLTLKAWDANPPSNSVPEPGFIKSLRSLQMVHSMRGTQGQNSDATSLKMTTNTTPAIDPALVSDSNAVSRSLSGDVSYELGDDLDLDIVDWNFWDQLIQEYQAQGDQQ
ncbi:hypothetical protein LTR37_016981 [Vermiconidia calcicola]|uniref:Uncharacterized protein n=1 Tax=Vermiconidia calcicola TaxID=1690605 RepID=A0ACC3MM93_9PEZI|nr:hypothetical protein LTR37_016981 [Vermiconidia calcicola]